MMMKKINWKPPLWLKLILLLIVITGALTFLQNSNKSSLERLAALQNKIVCINEINTLIERLEKQLKLSGKIDEKEFENLLELIKRVEKVEKGEEKVLGNLKNLKTTIQKYSTTRSQFEKNMKLLWEEGLKTQTVFTNWAEYLKQASTKLRTSKKQTHLAQIYDTLYTLSKSWSGILAKKWLYFYRATFDPNSFMELSESLYLLDKEEKKIKKNIKHSISLLPEKDKKLFKDVRVAVSRFLVALNQSMLQFLEFDPLEKTLNKELTAIKSELKKEMEELKRKFY